MTMSDGPSRRDFLRTAGAGAAGVVVPGLARPLAGLGAGPAKVVLPDGVGEARRPGGLLVRGGTLVTAGGRAEADLRVRGERVVAIAEGLEPEEGERVLDATGLLVLPGGIDPHVHLTQPEPSDPRFRLADDLATGSEAALAGGITTVGNMTFPGSEETLEGAVARDVAAVAERAIADVILHPVARDPAEAREALPALLEAGHTSLKVFMTLPAFVERTEEYLELIAEAGASGMLCLIHCEDRAILEWTEDRMVAEGRRSLRHFAESRPVEAEVAATQRAVAFCETTGAPFYIVHLSSARALEICRTARTRGLPIHVETRPLYLHLTRERYAGPDGPLYVGQPPLRTAADVEALWAGLAHGLIQTVGTDHVGWSREQKLDPSLDITDLRPGVNNLEVMLPMLYSEGVAKDRISLERFVELTSTNAAKLFGLYPRKGTIAVGADADLALWDPAATRTIRADELRSRSGYSVYEGWAVTGWPTLTVRRGDVVYADGQVVAGPGGGRPLPRGATRRI
jgi:dihydropyrimidinase